MEESYKRMDTGEFEITTTVSSERVETVTIEEIDADIAVYQELIATLEAKKKKCLEA